MFGLINVYKPPGPTSHDIVARIRRRLPRKTKVGHAGTLDPFAEGVLVICIGPATRLAEVIQAQQKRYRAEVALGAVSSTDDPEGEITPVPAAPHPGEQAIRDAAKSFVGEIGQIPPAHSAVHINGRRAYELARAGEAADIPARLVQIHAVEVVSYDWPRVALDIRCGSGTYIRSVARDLGDALGTGGYCRALTRTAVGNFELTGAVRLDQLQLPRDVLPPTAALSEMPTVRLDEQQVRRLRLGQRVAIDARLASGLIAALDAAGRLVALCSPEDGRRQLRPRKVFPPQ
ncbi:MAG: tRNA pseudouridine(55) synthase TruB [Planctomycetota bacterium]